MAFTRWPDFEDRLRWPEEFFKAFTPFFTPPVTRSAGVFPAVNIYDDGEAFLVRVEVPGIDKEALEVSVKGDQLTLRGERKLQTAGPNASYHRREAEGGQFRRAVTLPQPVDAEKISATYKDGVLEIVLPRAASVQPRKISVQ